MTEKSIFRYKVDPRRVDFTERASISSMCDIILEAAGEDAYKRGFGIDVLAERNLGWVLSRMCVELDYMPAEYSEFTIRTWISDYNRLASTRNFTLTDDEGRMFGRAVSQWCMLDFSTRMPADVNLLARMHEGVMVDAPSPCERPRRIAAVGSEPTAKHRVVYSDIDFNRHMNTMRYIAMVRRSARRRLRFRVPQRRGRGVVPHLAGASLGRDRVECGRGEARSALAEGDLECVLRDAFQIFSLWKTPKTSIRRASTCSMTPCARR